MVQLMNGRGSGFDPKTKTLLSNNALLDLFEIFVEEIQQNVKVGIVFFCSTIDLMKRSVCPSVRI